VESINSIPKFKKIFLWSLYRGNIKMLTVKFKQLLLSHQVKGITAIGNTLKLAQKLTKRYNSDKIIWRNNFKGVK
jgi:hypothetical protein